MNHAFRCCWNLVRHGRAYFRNAWKKNRSWESVYIGYKAQMHDRCMRGYSHRLQISVIVNFTRLLHSSYKRSNHFFSRWPIEINAVVWLFLSRFNIFTLNLHLNFSQFWHIIDTNCFYMIQQWTVHFSQCWTVALLKHHERTSSNSRNKWKEERKPRKTRLISHNPTWIGDYLCQSVDNRKRRL